MQTISSGGDELTPAYYILKAKGYQLIRTPSAGSKTGERWIAESKDRQFLADEIVALLSLVSMYETCGLDESAVGREQSRGG